MKVTVEQAHLLKALGHVYRVVEKRNTIPILSNVLIRAENGRLALKATDLDIEAAESIEADIAEAGVTTVPAHVLHEIVRKLSEGAQVSLEQVEGGGTIILRSGRSRFTLQSLPDTDFPDQSSVKMSHEFSVPAAELRQLLEKTQFAISTEETRYYLNGIYFHTVGEEGSARLRAVATDGHRLAQSEVVAPEGALGMPGVIIPRKTVSEMHKLVSETQENVRIELSEVKIRFSLGSVVLTSKLIDGTFPDYNRVIPHKNNKMLTLDRSEFQRAVDRVSTISGERGRAVKLHMADAKLTLSVNNPDAGQAIEEIMAEYEAEPLEIGFNARYLMDIAAQLSTDTMLLKLMDSGAPCLIQEKEGASSLFVLMPMRV